LLSTAVRIPHEDVRELRDAEITALLRALQENLRCGRH
jgi:hypothetical protein